MNVVNAAENKNKQKYMHAFCFIPECKIKVYL